QSRLSRILQPTCRWVSVSVRRIAFLTTVVQCLQDRMRSSVVCPTKRLRTCRRQDQKQRRNGRNYWLHEGLTIGGGEVVKTCLSGPEVERPDQGENQAPENQERPKGHVHRHPPPVRYRVELVGQQAFAVAPRLHFGEN